MKEDVTIYEVGPRDGLQNEKKLIPTQDKIKLVDALTECGFTKVEVTSFVSPKWVPQMSDAVEVLEGINRKESVTYAALTPNMKGFERALSANLTEISIFAAATEGFSRANINCSIEESLARFVPVLKAARDHGIAVRGCISCVTDCPYDGSVDPISVVRVAKALTNMGCYEISLADTIGAGTPDQVAKMLDAILNELPADRLAGHFHDTNGRALENIAVSLEKGLRVFDSSVGGLGGCPYAPGATGNVASESVVHMMEKMGYETGLDLEKISQVATFVQTLVQRNG
ncbi:MAG: hydroxymethylglutaryl-CoA lyase [Aestuariivita sp.]|nr:hydroxymethylglutaryl-CoA lyase [Aestuariivita sp.]